LPIINRFGVISGVGQFGHAHQSWVVWWAIARWFGLPLTFFGWHGKQARDILFVGDMLHCRDCQLDLIIYWIDNRKAARYLNWRPQTSLQLAFARMFDWIGQNESELRLRYIT